MPRQMPKFTKTPPEVVAAFDAASPSRKGIDRKTMFSYPALFVNGNMFAFTFGPKIAVRADEATRSKPGMKRFEPMPGRPMGEYVEVPAKDMNGAAAFLVCGGYQLFGSEYLPEVGDPIPGLGVLDVRTKAGTQRFVGNLVVETPEGLLVGFENHSGRTYLGPRAVPLGAVVVGHGNNGEDHTEGAVQGKLVGTYSHGSCLPKNPWLADKLLTWALEPRHGSVTLEELDDREERLANEQAATVARARP